MSPAQRKSPSTTKESKGERQTNDRCGGKKGDHEYCELGIP